MAARHQRNGKHIVIQQYLDDKGNKRKKWHTFDTKEEAVAAFPEIEKAEKQGRIYRKPRYARKKAIHYENSAEQSCATVKDIVEAYIAQHCAEEPGLPAAAGASSITISIHSSVMNRSKMSRHTIFNSIMPICWRMMR